MVRIPWSAEVEAGNGVSLYADEPRVYHTCRRLGKDASDVKAQEVAADAAQFPYCLRMMAFCSDAFDIQMAGTRRTMCADYSSRAFFAFFTQAPYVVAPKIERLSRTPVGSMETEKESEADDYPPAGRRRGLGG